MKCKDGAATEDGEPTPLYGHRSKEGIVRGAVTEFPSTDSQIQTRSPFP